MSKCFKKQVGILVLLILVIAGVMTGCGTKKENTGSDVESTESVYPITVTDSSGVEVTIEKEPQRIVSIAPSITELMYKLGAQDKLVGRTDYCDYPEEAAQIASVGSMREPNMEKIISLEPDVVVSAAHFSDENIEKLRELGIKVIKLYEEHSMSGVYPLIDTLGAAVNRQAEAKATIEEMKKIEESVTEKVKDLEKPSVYYVVGYGDRGDHTAGGDTFIGNMLEAAGGENIASDVEGWSYSLESLIEKDPEFIILEDAEGAVEAFCSTNGYKDLTAVKNGQVYTINKDLLNRQGYRNAQGLEELAKILHKDSFQ